MNYRDSQDPWCWTAVAAAFALLLILSFIVALVQRFI